MTIRTAVALVALLLTGVGIGPALAGDDGFGLRLLPEVLWAEAAAESFGESRASSIDEVIHAQLQESAADAFPGAWEAGLARSEGGPMQLELGGLFHLALRVSRYQVREIRYGDEKTLYNLYLTGSLSILNLGSGEILEGRTATVLHQSEVLGSAGRSADAVQAADRGAARTLVRTLVDDLAERFSPGLIEAEVVGQYGKRDVLARGYLDGAYEGEVFRLPDGGRVRLEQVQERLSLGNPLGPGGRPAVGSVVRRVGQAASAGDAPRLMVVPVDPDGEAGPGVSGGELAQWLSDGLAQAGFPVLPSAADLNLSQMSEAAELDVARDQIVGSMVRPDVFVIPWVVRHGLQEQADAERDANVYLLTVEVGCSFVDASTGIVLHGARTTITAEEYTQAVGRQADVAGAFVGLIKDAAGRLATEAADSFRPRRAYGTLLGPADAGGEIRWRPDGPLLGRGSTAALLSRSKEYTSPRTGTTLGAVENLIGRVRVNSGGGETERGRVLTATQPAARGQRIRATVRSGGGGGGTRVVELGAVSVDRASVLSEEQLRHIGQSVLATSGLFMAVLDDHEMPSLGWTKDELSDSASYDLTREDGQETTLATHRLDLRLTFRVGETEARKRLLRRAFKIEITGSLIDLATGTAEVLHSPSKGDVLEYSMWLEREIFAKESRNALAVGFGDEDVPGQLEALTVDALQEFMRRVTLLVGDEG